MSNCTLVMDTSSSPLRVALQKDGQVYRGCRKGIKQEKLLFPLLRGLLNKAQADWRDISRILIVRGPGRFTGIRIALTFASMLQMLNHTRVYGITLFEGLVRQVYTSRSYKIWHKQHPQGAVAVVLHAFRDEYFLQIWEDTPVQPQWLSRAALQARLAAYPGDLFVCGTDKENAHLADWLGTGYTFAADKEGRVRMDTLLQLAQEETGAQQALEPLYLKPARFELEVPK